MKIAVLSNSAFSMLNFRGPLLAEMRNRGHEVIAMAPDFDASTRADIRAMGVETVDFAMSRSGTNPLKEIAVIADLRRLMRMHQPDVSFAYFLKPVMYGMIASRMAGVPGRFGLIAGLGYAFTDDGRPNLQRHIARFSGSLMMRLTTVCANRILFQNPNDLEESLSIGLVVPAKASLVGATGVDLDDWRPVPLPEGSITFILVARLLRDKGIGEFVEAARILRRDFPDAQFLVVGGIDDNPVGITREEMDAWVAEGLIEWPGHVKVKPWLARAHVFVLPSYYREGVPRSTQEAMALGRPVITTDAPGCRETVVEGHNGFMIPPRDPQALAMAMRHFIDNPGDIARMGAESRKLAEERFDVHLQNDKLLGYMGL